jgi:hypothetical protein
MPCAQCEQQFSPAKPWQTHCSPRCRKLSYEHTDAGKRRTLRYSSSARRRVTRAVARLRWVRDYFVSELRDRDDSKTGPPRLTTQSDLRHVRWERLPVAYRKHAESAGLGDKKWLLREWRKFWTAQIREAKAGQQLDRVPEAAIGEE